MLLLLLKVRSSASMVDAATSSDAFAVGPVSVTRVVSLYSVRHDHGWYKHSGACYVAGRVLQFRANCRAIEACVVSRSF